MTAPLDAATLEAAAQLAERRMCFLQQFGDAPHDNTCADWVRVFWHLAEEIRALTNARQEDGK